MGKGFKTSHAIIIVGAGILLVLITALTLRSRNSTSEADVRPSGESDIENPNHRVNADDILADVSEPNMDDKQLLVVRLSGLSDCEADEDLQAPQGFGGFWPNR